MRTHDKIAQKEVNLANECSYRLVAHLLLSGWNLDIFRSGANKRELPQEVVVHY